MDMKPVPAPETPNEAAKNQPLPPENPAPQSPVIQTQQVAQKPSDHQAKNNSQAPEKQTKSSSPSPAGPVIVAIIVFLLLTTLAFFVYRNH